MESASPDQMQISGSARNPRGVSRGPMERWQQRQGFFFWALIATLNPPVALAALWLKIFHPHPREAAKSAAHDTGAGP